MSSLAFRAIKATGSAQRVAAAQNVTRRFAHGEANSHMPFDYSNKRTFAVKASVYMGLGFAIPFVAIWWTWNKPGGIHNTASTP
ncbi:hypothetical protein BDQ17DRAFT_1356518 [Cyathus striatus]|nr:hypothetical protein BDQ17DRAFT_1356518 [Cyathus striatus]